MAIAARAWVLNRLENRSDADDRNHLDNANARVLEIALLLGYLAHAVITLAAALFL